ncbi:hypothetical protein HS088_TW20G00243 [Tripterygium wilfordii]|uniref:Uncharacterized protein n=1 Tax=Tripterygium wilfordii TaxID=458696 RepID=A0A7J7C7R1_TRIWF|nr:uncharacterized protein LOC119987358 [Tripterygium wilfordii]KAF5729877.1 hypothetical protein HS088_TW20G00243 [Tripterygium wilfordii]
MVSKSNVSFHEVKLMTKPRGQGETVYHDDAIQHRRRFVSATRDFPIGCGPVGKFPSPALKGLAQSELHASAYELDSDEELMVSGKGLAYDSDSDSDESVISVDEKAGHKLTAKAQGSAYDSKPEFVVCCGEKGGLELTAKVESTGENLQKARNTSELQAGFLPKVYPLPRKISATRFFPPGCGTYTTKSY